MDTQTGFSIGEKVRLQKLIISLFLLILTLGFYFSRANNTLWPYIPISAFVSMAILFPVIPKDHKRAMWIITLFTLSSVLIKVFIFSFPPSMIGFDPDTYAISISRIMESGHTQEAISNFYADVPLFLIFSSVFGKISSVSPANSLIIYPVLIGVIFPLTAAIYSYEITSSIRISAISSGMISILSISTAFSYHPIPHTLATMIFLVSILGLIGLKDKPSSYHIIVTTSLLALIFTHKLHPVIFPIIVASLLMLNNWQFDINKIIKNNHLIAIGCLAILIWAYVAYQLFWGLALVGTLMGGILIKNNYRPEKHRIRAKKGQLFPKNGLKNIFLVSIALAGIQWSILSKLAYGVTTRYLLEIIGFSNTQISTTYEFLYAEPATFGYLEIVSHRADVLLTFLLIGLGFLIIFHRYEDYSSQIILSTVAIPLMLAPLALFAGVSGGLGSHRILFSFSPIAIAIVSPLFDSKRRLVKSMFLIFILFQVFSPTFVPDAPNNYRSYLNEEEVAAKEFALENIKGPVHTDYFYSTESIKPLSKSTYVDESNFHPLRTETLLAKRHIRFYENVMLRTQIQIYRSELPVLVELKWTPSKIYDKEYNRIYDSGGVVSYTKNL